MEMIELLERAKRQLAAATGLKPVEVTRASKDAQGWHVGVDMLEMSRIPAATDVLGEYDVALGEDGTMVRFARKRTRLRGAPLEEETSSTER
ncbi:MAG: gas vesicle protein [Chloroflexi bacterium]|nr:gas vesicle protein [Chloroflexota bacterium]